MIRTTLLLFLLMLSAPSAYGATLHVPNDYALIGDALAAAQDGDLIVVHPGVYSPSTNGESFPLLFDADNVWLRGAGIGETILDAEQSATVIDVSAMGSRISFMTITGGAENWGGGIHVIAGDVEIDHTLITQNGALQRGSGINVSDGAAPYIHHNVVWQNYDTDLGHSGDPHGIQIGGASVPVVEHNLIGEHDSNGLFSLESSEPTVRNNIFLNNGTPGVRGRGICHFGGDNSVIAYNLFWGNAISAIVMPTGMGNENLSAVDADAVDPVDGLYGNIDADPLLVDPANLDFHLTSISPAIDAGDPSSPFDPDGTRADIGPFFHGVGTATPPNLGFRIHSASPNPFLGEVTIHYELSRSRTVRASLFDLRGRRVRSVDLATRPSGPHEFILAPRDDDGRSLAAGVYLFVLEGEGERVSVPLVKVR